MGKWCFDFLMNLMSSLKLAILTASCMVAVACSMDNGLYKETMISSSLDTTRKDAVCITWMGTAGLYVTDGETGFFIDPFVSRYSLMKVLCGFSLPAQTHIIEDWINRTGCRQAQAVIVTHSHYDHALDAPFFAQKTEGLLVGSDSTAWIGLGAGLPEKQIKVVRPGDRLNLGKFEIVFIESRHSKAVLGRVPWPGEINGPLTPPAAASRYRLGQVFSLFVTHPNGSFVHLGSAGYREGMFKDLTAHTIFLCIAGREDTRELLRCTALAVKAKQIIPIHFDDFFRPVDDEMTILRGVNLPEFYQTASLTAPDLLIQTAPLGRQFVLF
jgi:L-ascorbate metabolism protein UlaG (beta-lactamase superfamily)